MEEHGRTHGPHHRCSRIGRVVPHVMPDLQLIDHQVLGSSCQYDQGFSPLESSTRTLKHRGCYECSPYRRFGHACGSRRKSSYSHSVLMTSLIRDLQGSPRYSSLACSSDMGRTSTTPMDRSLQFSSGTGWSVERPLGIEFLPMRSTAATEISYSHRHLKDSV